MRRVVQRMPVKGKAGTGTVARLLEAGLWNASDQSELEREAMLLFRRCHLPVPERQYMIFDGNRRLAVVDFAWPKARVIVEAEGFRFHSGRVAWERDIARYNELVLCGWTVLRLTYENLRNDAETFTESLARALNRSHRGGSAARPLKAM
jgi:very-short-patch-repair endonuclease